MFSHTLRHLSLSILGLAVAAPVALAQRTPSTNAFHEAYYLHHEKGDLKAALPLYRRAASDTNTAATQRAEAARFAKEIAEELATSDFARLVPGDTIFYLEFNRPGAQLQSLIDQLGLNADGGKLGISPRLVESLLGVRGAAFAITDIDPRNGPRNGVAILHPGDLDVVRGLLETALPFGGQPVEAIRGHPTFHIEGEVFVTTTSRLVLVSPDREQIEGVIARLDGAGDGGLAGRESMASAMQMRGDDLLFFCVNLEPIMPALMNAMQHEMRRDPEARAAITLLDLESTRFLAGRAGVGADGISFDMAVELDEGHRNIAFNLLRMPPLDESALDMVPSGTAFFWTAAINHKGSLPEGAVDAEGRPVVTMLDFGREIFANVADVALFAMPSAQRTPVGPIPDAALAVRVNDPERSRALWRFMLGTAQAASGSGAEVRTTRRGDVTLDRYEIQGMPVFVATDGQHLIASASEAAIERAVEARRKGDTLRKDPAYRSALTALGDSCVEVAALNVGRCGELASHFMSDREKREAMPIFGMMRDTSFWFGVEQSDRRLAIQGRIVGVPNLGPMVQQLVEQEMRRGGRRISTASAPTAEARLEEIFAKLHTAGRSDAARTIANKLHSDAATDAQRLNNFAWALLTDELYGNAYGDLALAIAKTANEASDWSNWYYLDTYATALFHHGRIDEAIDIEQKAIAVGADDPRIAEAKATLERFLAAKGTDAATVSR